MVLPDQRALGAALYYLAQLLLEGKVFRVVVELAPRGAGPPDAEIIGSIDDERIYGHVDDLLDMAHIVEAHHVQILRLR